MSIYLVNYNANDVSLQLYFITPHMCVPGFVAEQFLNSTATQLTYHGLCELTSTVQEGELCVFFRNNHFSTMTKFKVFTSTHIYYLNIMRGSELEGASVVNLKW